MAICWQDDVPDNFNARRGLCFGKTAGLSVENCDSLKYFTHTDIGWHRTTSDYRVYYTVIGQQDILPAYSYSDLLSLRYRDIYSIQITDKEHNWITTQLEPGQTYYYRTFAEGQVEEGGQVHTAYFYGPEKSFRVPRVIADNDYFSYVRPGKEAVDAFAEHFPDNVTPPTWEQIETLWNEWRSTLEGAAIDLTADTSTEQFDDGTGYRLNHLPDEFYTWLTQREIVIDAFDGLCEISTTTYNGEEVETAEPQHVNNVDEAWGVPGGKYIRFMPVFSTVNHEVTYRSQEVVPGVHYQLTLNFAPETEYENVDSTANDLLPTRVRITAESGKASNLLFENEEVAATELTTLEVGDFSATTMGLNLVYETRTTSTQVRRGTYNRIMRIAEARLVPIKEE